MNSLSEVEEGSVKALVEKLPVEDIWTLDAEAARECHLDTDPNLVVIVPGSEDPLKIESKAAEILGGLFPGGNTGVFVFPQSAVERTPRPLLVKMAFTSGRKIFGR